MQRAVFCLAVLAALSSSCAKVADPLPPAIPPRAVQDLEVERQGNSLGIEFSFHAERGLTAQVYVACGRSAHQDSDFKLMSSVSRVQMLPTAKTGRYRLVADNPGNPPCEFFVRFQDSFGRISAPSNRARLP